MYARPLHRDWELIKWAAIVSLAGAITIALANVLGAAEGQNVAKKAGLLPPAIGAWAKPMSESKPQSLGMEVWRILGLHNDNKYEDALDAWRKLPVPPETELWKLIAMGQAGAATRDFATAEAALAKAKDLQPDHPVVHYCLGILRLQQAAVAVDWPDNYNSRTRLVTYPPLQIVPNTKSMYVLAARMEFEQAIAQGDTIHLDESLIPPSMSAYVPLEPTVGDLLIALGAENFVGKSHNILGYQYLESGALEIAEEHMDAAVRNGMTDIYGFDDLAKAYRERGQFVDAARANLKALAHGHDKVRPALDTFRNLRDALINP